MAEKATKPDITSYKWVFTKLCELYMLDDYAIARASGMKEQQMMRVTKGEPFSLSIEELDSLLRIIRDENTRLYVHSVRHDELMKAMRSTQAAVFYGLAANPPGEKFRPEQEIEFANTIRDKDLREKQLAIITPTEKCAGIINQLATRFKNFHADESDPAQAEQAKKYFAEFQVRSFIRCLFRSVKENDEIIAKSGGAKFQIYSGATKIQTRAQVEGFLAKPETVKVLARMKQDSTEAKRPEVNFSPEQYCTEWVLFQHRKSYGPLIGKTSCYNHMNITDGNYFKRLAMYYGKIEIGDTETTKDKSTFAETMANLFPADYKLRLEGLVCGEQTAAQSVAKKALEDPKTIQGMITALGVDKAKEPDLFNYEVARLTEVFEGLERKDRAAPVRRRPRGDGEAYSVSPS